MKAFFQCLIWFSVPVRSMPESRRQTPGAADLFHTTCYKYPGSKSRFLPALPYRACGRQRRSAPVQRLLFRPGERAAIRFLLPYRSPGRNESRKTEVPAYSRSQQCIAIHKLQSVPIGTNKTMERRYTPHFTHSAPGGGHGVVMIRCAGGEQIPALSDHIERIALKGADILLLK